MDPLRNAARRDPSAPALEGWDGTGMVRSWSYEELDAWADATALRLQSLGCGMGSLVATLLPASPEAVVLLHAVPRAGGVLLPLNPAWPQGEVEGALGAVGGVALLVQPGSSFVPRDPDPLAAHTLPVEVATGEGSQLAPAGGWGEAVAPPDPDTPLAVLLTSGSTGRPRPIPLTRGNLEASSAGVARRLRLDSSDRWLASLSPAHVGGLALVYRAAFVGSALLTLPRFNAEQVGDLLAAGEVTHASLVPVMLQRILDAWGDRPPPRRLRAILLGGAATPAPLLLRALDARFPVALTYGLTEATSQVTTAPPDRVRERPGALGRPLPGVELRIAARNERGVGEIQVRGPTVAPLAPTHEGIGVGVNGWLRTGDLGRIDEEGDLHVVGRLSDRIISGGVTVEPAEIEAALLTHPGVSGVAVISEPDPEWGERVVAFVVLGAEGAPDASDLTEWARSHLAPAKRPRRWVFLEALPLNTNSKVDRRALRELALVSRAGDEPLGATP